ncbi:MAG TPA: NAD-dependent epimerase/dehydratase family protein [Phycisphaerae bacterium]|nr:NAD-dependent epimerase/dehydratase family protein [Phycisphaerae bacterium]
MGGKKALITGGAGFIGSNLAKYLVDEGYDTTILDNFSSGTFTNLVGFPGEIITSNGDTQPPGRYEIIFHQASITDTTVTDENKMMTNNVERFRNVLAWAEHWKARVVWASSAAVYGNINPPMAEDSPVIPLNVYGYSKLVMERMAHRWHRETANSIIGLRYFNVYGPGEAHKGKFASMIHQLAQQMKAGKRPRIFRDGSQKRDFVWIDDIMQANLLAVHVATNAKCCHIFNVGSGRAESFNTVIATLNNVLKTSLEPDYFENPYSFFQTHTEADIKRAVEVLGYEPKYNLAQGILAYHATGTL